MIGLYLFGILMGIGTAFVFRKTLFKGEPVPFVMELPNYRMPGAKNVGHLLWDKAKDFLQRAFTVIFMATLVIWFLQTFDLHLNIFIGSFPFPVHGMPTTNVFDLQSVQGVNYPHGASPDFIGNLPGGNVAPWHVLYRGSTMPWPPWMFQSGMDD
mgnify:CR=1 FL=1